MIRDFLPAAGISALVTGLILAAIAAEVKASPERGAAQSDSSWIDIHPMRTESFTEGRTVTYNSERFLHRFSYRNLSHHPRPGEDGLWGTGGSITGDQLYIEINGQYTHHLDNGRYAVVLRSQRSEDFDGRFDRNMVGVSRQFGDNWDGLFIADITADKGLVDFQLEATWRPQEGQFLRIAAAQPDRLYNNKGDHNRGDAVGNKFARTPTTLFVNYRHPVAGGGHLETALNYTPTAEYLDRRQGYTVEADQLRLMSEFRVPLVSQWYGGARLELERSARDFSELPTRYIDEQIGTMVPGNDFRRDSQHIMLTLDAPDRLWSPHGGLRYFELDEKGWFGTGLATDGSNFRREIGGYAGFTLRTGENHWLAPTLFVQNVELDRRFVQRADDDRQRDEFVGKIILPWRWIVNRENGAVLSLNPTFRVHRFAFGGGNVQLHWPL